MLLNKIEKFWSYLGFSDKTINERQLLKLICLLGKENISIIPCTTEYNLTLQVLSIYINKRGSRISHKPLRYDPATSDFNREHVEYWIYGQNFFILEKNFFRKMPPSDYWGPKIVFFVARIMDRRISLIIQIIL